MPRKGTGQGPKQPTTSKYLEGTSYENRTLPSDLSKEIRSSFRDAGILDVNVENKQLREKILELVIKEYEIQKQYNKETEKTSKILDKIANRQYDINLQSNKYTEADLKNKADISKEITKQLNAQLLLIEREKEKAEFVENEEARQERLKALAEEEN